MVHTTLGPSLHDEYEKRNRVDVARDFSAKQTYLLLTAMAVTGILGTLFYVSILLLNAVAVLSEERFLARSKSLTLQRN